MAASGETLQVAAVAVSLAGALAYIGKMVIASFCENMKEQQRFTQNTLTEHTIALRDLIAQSSSWQDRATAAHTEQCRSLQAITETLIALGYNGKLERMITREGGDRP